MAGPRDREYSQEELDNHANQLNPNHDAYWQSRGWDERPDDWEEQEATAGAGAREYSNEELDNHANQHNRNHDAYWQSRGWDKRPDNWESLPEDHDGC